VFGTEVGASCVKGMCNSASQLHGIVFHALFHRLLTIPSFENQFLRNLSKEVKGWKQSLGLLISLHLFQL